MNCRFLYLIGQLGPGGAERQLYYLLEVMDRKRYQPAVAVWNFSEQDVYASRIRALGVPLYTFSDAGSAAVHKLKALRRLVTQLEPEVLQSFSFYLNIVAHWGVQNTRTVAVGSVRGDFIEDAKSMGWWLCRASARWPRCQIYNSFRAVKNIRRSHCFFIPKQLSVVHNGIDLQRFRMTPVPMTARTYILGVGSLLAIKRWDRLLSASQILKQNGYDFLIRIVGDGPLRETLEQQAQALGVTDRVEFIGHSDNIPGLLADAAFLVHPSDSEGCPNVIMEAMACGRAVVTTDTGDIPELVEDGKNGFVVCCGDDTLLGERMATLITDRTLCRAMGKAGRAKAEREFGLDRLVSAMFAAYRAAGWRDA